MTNSVKNSWQAIPGFLGYEAHPDGRVRSILDRWSGPRVLKPKKHARGYLQYGLTVGGRMMHRFGHRLVGLTFIPNPNGLPQINHLNGIKDHNRSTNLEWATPASNAKHAREIGLYQTGEAHHHARFTDAEVIEMLVMLDAGNPPKAVTRKFDITYDQLKAIRKGRQRIPAVEAYRAMIAACGKDQSK